MIGLDPKLKKLFSKVSYSDKSSRIAELSMTLDHSKSYIPTEREETESSKRKQTVI